MTQHATARSSLPPPIKIGRSVTYQGEDYFLIGLQSVPERGHALACRLWGTDGTHGLLLLEYLYADMLGGDPNDPGATPDPKSEWAAGTSATADYLGQPFEPPASLDREESLKGATEGPAHSRADKERDGAATRPDASPPPSVKGTRDMILDGPALLEGLPARAAELAKARASHLLEATTGFPDGLGTPDVPPDPRYDPAARTLSERLRAKAEELGVAERTLWRQYQAFGAQGLWGLVDGRAKKVVDPVGNIDPRIVEAIYEQADVEVLSSTGTRTRFYSQLVRRLEVKYGHEVPVMPSRSTLQRAIKAILWGQQTFGDASSRRSRALSPTTTFHPLRASRPGQLVLLDATPLDVRAYEPPFDTNLSLTLTLALDLSSRSLLAWRILPEADNRADAVLLLADMIRPEVMRPHWREELAYRMLCLPEDVLINYEARFAGAAAKPVIHPETVIIDHAKVYTSDAFTEGCRLLGVNVQPARKLQPTDKPDVERLFGRIAHDFSQHMAGYKGRNTASRGPIADTQARFSIAEIEEFFAEWVVSIYQRKPHHGLPNPLNPRMLMSPNEAYAAAVARSGWIPAPVNDTLYYDLLPIHWRQLHRWGLVIDYRVYDHPILRKYDEGVPSPYLPPVTAKGRTRGRQEGTRPKGQLWPIHIDPRDLCYAYFFSVEEQRWYALPWSAGIDLQPFSESYYGFIRKWMKDHGRDETHEKELAATIAEFQGRIGAPESWTATNRRQFATQTARAREVARDRAGSAPIEDPDGRLPPHVITEEPEHNSWPDPDDVAPMPPILGGRTNKGED